MHTSFAQAVAATGRLSSHDPNLQNIPIRTAVGREIRGAFTAPPGSVLISADYSQIELRVLAHLSGDPNLTGAFERGEDIHDRTAFKVFGADSGLDPHELRRRAKIINYALLYGKTAFTLSKDIGVTPKDAQRFIDAYFEGFPAVRAYLEGTLETARETGVVTTMLGRRRRVPEIVSRNGQLRSAAERVAVNMPIQGSAADILKRAMIDVHADLPQEARMILTVHDELLFEAPESRAREVAELVRTRMESARRVDGTAHRRRRAGTELERGEGLSVEHRAAPSWSCNPPGAAQRATSSKNGPLVLVHVQRSLVVDVSRARIFGVPRGLQIVLRERLDVDVEAAVLTQILVERRQEPELELGGGTRHRAFPRDPRDRRRRAPRAPRAARASQPTSRRSRPCRSASASQTPRRRPGRLRTLRATRR